MEDRLDLAKRSVGEQLIERCGVHVVRDLQIDQVAKLVALRQIIDRDDVGDAARIEPLDDIAANKAGSPGDNDSGHANNSS